MKCHGHLHRFATIFRFADNLNAGQNAKLLQDFEANGSISVSHDVHSIQQLTHQGLS
jgi:hypothetical protein